MLLLLVCFISDSKIVISNDVVISESYLKITCVYGKNSDLVFRSSLYSLSPKMQQLKSRDCLFYHSFCI